MSGIKGSSVAATGMANTQFVGDNNQQISNTQIFLGQHSLTHSVVHDLLSFVYDNAGATAPELKLENPVALNPKLLFNNAPKYVHMISQCSEDFALVDSAMHGFPDSEKIIKKLRLLFLDVAKYDENAQLVISDGDSQLDAIKGKLAEIIQADLKYDPIKYPTEDIERFCVALIACGVSKCIVLMKPEDNVVD